MSVVRIRLDTQLRLIFFLSGIAALTYQVCWQRLLFGSFGVDIESVTVVVSTFMLGLGCGALLGGYLADRFRSRILSLFAFCELGIGFFGLASPKVIPAVGSFFVQYSLPVVVLVNFLLLLIPTTLMGATLPMLVVHAAQRKKNIGDAVGTLYFVNTIGAAAGAFCAGLVFFHFLTLSKVILTAAGANFFVALVAYLGFRRESQSLNEEEPLYINA